MLRKNLSVLPLLFALALTSTACLEAPSKFSVTSPEQGQLIRDAGAFEVKIHLDETFLDAGSLQAEINGVPMTTAVSNGEYSATLSPGSTLNASNQLVVMAKTLEDGTPRVLTVEFSWEALPQGLEFLQAFVEDPPPVETADLEILHATTRRQNAILRVTFEEGFNAPIQIPFRVDAQTVFFLDDSGVGDDAIANDGEYTARIDFDYENYRIRKMKEAIVSATSEDEATSVEFSGREIVAKKVPTLVPAVSSSSTLPTISLTSSSAVTPVVDSERALMIRDLSVVSDPVRTFDPCDTDGDGLTGDPNGAWSFKTLMSGMANTAGTGIPLDAFVQQWLAAWARNFDVLHDGSASGDWIINNDVVPQREGGLLASIINPWPKTSIGTLDMDQAPFRLLSIVNRVDLREAVGYGPGSSTAGELRFVFGLLDMNTCSPDRMTAIFEYTVHVNTCTDVINYAQQWEDLDTIHPPFPASPGYLAHLQSITDRSRPPESRPWSPTGVRSASFERVRSPWARPGKCASLRCSRCPSALRPRTYFGWTPPSRHPTGSTLSTWHCSPFSRTTSSPTWQIFVMTSTWFRIRGWGIPSWRVARTSFRIPTSGPPESPLIRQAVARTTTFASSSRRPRVLAAMVGIPSTQPSIRASIT